MNQPYSKKVMQLFTKPHNMGLIKNADGTGEFGNPVCLVKGTTVQLNNHLSNIEEVSASEKILTHEGTYSNILQESKRDYNGKVIRFSNKLGCADMTPEHLVFAIKVPKERKFYDHKVKKDLIPAWYHAEDLEQRDLALYPILKEVKEVKYLPLEFDKKKYDHRSFNLPKKVELDADFMRLAGYYLSEGNVSTKITKAYIGFTFHIKESEYYEDVKRIIKEKFGLDAKIKLRPAVKTAVVEVNSANLARIFENLFGKGAEHKKIPDFMFFLPPEKQKHLIEGLWKGDGYVNIERKGARAGYVTISPRLAGQVKMILLRLGIVPSVYVEEAKTIKGVSHKKSYRIHVGDKESLRKICKIYGKKFDCEGKEKTHSWISNGFLHTPITSRQELQYKGKVYNFEVENQHSYTTDAFCVHNCGDIMKIYIKVEEKKGKDYIKDVKFQTYGCASAIATSSMITDLVKGKSIDEAIKVTKKDVADALGGLPPIKYHCSNLAEDAFRNAVRDYYEKSGKKPSKAVKEILDKTPKEEEHGHTCG